MPYYPGYKGETTISDHTSTHRLSKWLSFFLRHSGKPYAEAWGYPCAVDTFDDELYVAEMDVEGWVRIADVLNAPTAKHLWLTKHGLREFFNHYNSQNNGGSRFFVTATHIRATHGHSIPGLNIEAMHVEITNERHLPQGALTHFTSWENYEKIKHEGLKSMERNNVMFLNTFPWTAHARSSRRKFASIAIVLDARKFLREHGGRIFYSSGKTYVTSNVLPQFFDKVYSRSTYEDQAITDDWEEFVENAPHNYPCGNAVGNGRGYTRRFKDMNYRHADDYDDHWEDYDDQPTDKRKDASAHQQHIPNASEDKFIVTTTEIRHGVQETTTTTFTWADKTRHPKGNLREHAQLGWSYPIAKRRRFW